MYKNKSKLVSKNSLNTLHENGEMEEWTGNNETKITFKKKPNRFNLNRCVNLEVNLMGLGMVLNGRALV